MQATESSQNIASPRWTLQFKRTTWAKSRQIEDSVDYRLYGSIVTDIILHKSSNATLLLILLHNTIKH